MVHQHQKGGRGGKRRNCPRQSRRIREKEKPKMTKKRMRRLLEREFNPRFFCSLGRVKDPWE